MSDFSFYLPNNPNNLASKEKIANYQNCVAALLRQSGQNISRNYCQSFLVLSLRDFFVSGQILYPAL